MSQDAGTAVPIGDAKDSDVDLWSVACIMLELTLGHVGFGNLWMKNYAMETICNKEAFDSKMRHCLEELPSYLRTNYRADVCDFLIPILTMCDDERPDTESLARHAYYAGEVIRGLEVQEVRPRSQIRWPAHLWPRLLHLRDEGRENQIRSGPCGPGKGEA